METCRLIRGRKGDSIAMEGPKIEEVLTYLDENFDNDLKAVQDFMRMKSISATGEGIRETAERVKEMIEECGGTSELIETPGNPIVYGRIDEKAEHTLLIYSMYDVTGFQIRGQQKSIRSEITETALSVVVQ